MTPANTRRVDRVLAGEEMILDGFNGERHAHAAANT
jgi:hypothetical protein